MKEFHAKKWLNEEFKKHDMWIEHLGSKITLMVKTDVSAMSVIGFVFEDWQWVAIPKTLSFKFCYDQLRLICGTVDELNRQHDMEMNV